MFKFWRKAKRKANEKITDIAMELVFTDQAGNKYYQYKNPLDLPAKRAIAAEVAARYAGMNLDKETLTGLLGEMRKAANDGNIVKLFSFVNEIEQRLDFIAEETTLLKLATVYFCINDEDPRYYQNGYQAEKLKLWEDDDAAKSFFLQRSINATKLFGDTSATDILDYLKQNQANANRLKDFTPIKT